MDNIVEVLLALATVLASVLLYYRRAYAYWDKKNLPFRPPTFPFGNLSNPFNRTASYGFVYKNHYEYFKERGLEHGGLFLFTIPSYVVIDPERIKRMVVKDFDHFTDRGLYHNEKDDPLTGNLFLLDGKKWRNLRAKLSPTFTSGKMKMMFNTLVECSKQLVEMVDGACEERAEMDVKDVMGRFTTDVISSCAFGLDCNSCRDPHTDFRRYGKRIFEFSRWQSIKNTFTLPFPNLGRLLGVTLFDAEVSDFFRNAFSQTVEYRLKNNVQRRDFMQLLLQLKEDEKGSEGGCSLSVAEMAAQAFAFFLGGFETSSITMSFALLEMCLNVEVQEKARREVEAVLGEHGGRVTYEALNEMTYLQQVIDETLRKYPVVPVLNRKCVKEYKVPGTDVVLEKGTPVFIPVLGIHYDPEYYPDPEVFDPERFTEENKGKRHPFAYLPFGEGPRICIGMRFGLMQSKLGLTVLLRNYRFSLNEKTELPLKYNPYGFVMNTLNSIYLNFQKIPID